MLARLFLAFTIIPLAELYLLFRIGARIGVGTTVVIVVLTGWAGAVLARREGLRVFGQMQEKLQAGQMPTDAIVEGVVVLACGLLLITPGFMTDIGGLLLLIPPVRRALIARIKHHYAEKLRVQQGIIDVEVIDEDDRQ